MMDRAHTHAVILCLITTITALSGLNETSSNNDDVIFDNIWNINPNTSRLLDIYSNDAYLGSLADFIQQMCPEWTPCLEREPRMDDNVTCCLSCSCDDTCHMTRSCCPGVHNYNTTSQGEPETVCRKPILFAYGDTKVELDKQVFPWYKFVDRCPPFANTGFDKCSSGPTYGLKNAPIYDFADVIPVTVVSTGTHYLNRHCAACHGVNITEMEFWEPEISCDNAIDFNDLKRVEETVQQREDCYVMVSPPINIRISDESTCVTDVISGCNVTGNWEMYDAQTEAYCYDLNWLYRMPQPRRNSTVGGTFKRYKNIFCAICNGEQVVMPNTQLCPYDSMGRLSAFSFIGLVNYGDLTKPALVEGQGSNGSQQCAAGERLEPIQGRCKPVSCPYPLIWNIVNMKCVEIFRKFTNGIMQIPFAVDLGQSIPIQQIHSFQLFIIDFLERIYYSGSCGHYAVFFKGSIPYEDIQKNASIINTITLDSFIVVAYVTIESEDSSYLVNPMAAYSSFKNVILDRFSNETKYLLDTFFLTGRSMPDIQDVALNAQELNPTFGSLAVFEDPYDGYVVFGTNSSLSMDRAEWCIDYNVMFNDEFIECPTFMYDMVEYGIDRVENGIHFTDLNIYVGFENVRSVNYTHCIICIDAIGYAAPMGSGANNAHVTVCYGNWLLWTIIAYGLVITLMCPF